MCSCALPRPRHAHRAEPRPSHNIDLFLSQSQHWCSAGPPGPVSSISRPCHHHNSLCTLEAVTDNCQCCVTKHCVARVAISAVVTSVLPAQSNQHQNIPRIQNRRESDNTPHPSSWTFVYAETLYLETCYPVRGVRLVSQLISRRLSFWDKFIDLRAGLFRNIRVNMVATTMSIFHWFSQSLKVKDR